MNDPKNHDLREVLASTHEKFLGNEGGSVADYIPELGNAEPSSFAIALVTTKGKAIAVGDASCEFTIQSISKAYAFGLALAQCGPELVYTKVGTEPSGKAFNAIRFSPETGGPPNAMVNSGAIAICGLLRAKFGDAALDHLLSYFSALAGRPLAVDESVYESECRTGHRNRALAHLLRGAGILEGDIEETVDLYFRQCSIAVNSLDLATMAATVAAVGRNPVTGETILDALTVRHMLSVMFTCGMYDYAGRWAVDVGIPAKSGVSGGVTAVVNRQLGLSLYSPRVDVHGHSVRGIAACVHLAEELGLHAFEFTNRGSSILDAYL
jgi:glutaminase